MPAVSGWIVSVGVTEVSSIACCFRVDSVSGSEGGVVVCLLFQGTQCQWKKGRCHRLPAVSGWIVSVGSEGGVIVCLLFQGTQCQWKKGRCHRLPAVSGWIVSVRVNGGVIVCLLFQGGYISVSGSE